MCFVIFAVIGDAALQISRCQAKMLTDDQFILRYIFIIWTVAAVQPVQKGKLTSVRLYIYIVEIIPVVLIVCNEDPFLMLFYINDRQGQDHLFLF